MTTIAKVIEVNASSKKGLEDAIQGGLKRVSKSVKNIKGAWINDIKVVTEDDGTISEWRVDMKITFVVS